MDPYHPLNLSLICAYAYKISDITDVIIVSVISLTTSHEVSPNFLLLQNQADVAGMRFFVSFPFSPTPIALDPGRITNTGHLE